MPKSTTASSPFDFFPTPDPSRKRSIIHKSFSFIEQTRVLTDDDRNWKIAGKVETPTLMSCRALYYFLAPEILNHQSSAGTTGMDNIENEPWMDLLLAAPTVVYTPYVELGCRPARNTERLGRSLTFVRHLSLAAVVFNEEEIPNHEEEFYKALTKLRFIESLKMPSLLDRTESVLSAVAVQALTSNNFPNLETLELQTNPRTDDGAAALDTLLGNTKRSLRNLSLAACKQREGGPVSPRTQTYYDDKFLQSLSSHCIRLKKLKIQWLRITNENTLAPFARLNSLETLELDQIAMRPAAGEDDTTTNLQKIVESFSYLRDGICRSIRFLKIGYDGRNLSSSDPLCGVCSHALLYLFENSSSTSSSSPSSALYPQLQHFELQSVAPDPKIYDTLFLLSLDGGEQTIIAPALETLLLSEHHEFLLPPHPRRVSPFIFAKLLPNHHDNSNKQPSSKLRRIKVPDLRVTVSNTDRLRQDAETATVEKSIYQILSSLPDLEEISFGQIAVIPANEEEEEDDRSICLNNDSLIASSLRSFDNNLRELDFAKIEVGDNFLRAVGQSLNLRRTLEVFAVMCKRVSDGFLFLKDSSDDDDGNSRRWKNLKTLRIVSAHHISDRCAASVLTSISSTSLEHLSFEECCYVGDELCAALEHHVMLKSLCLSSTAVTGVNFNFLPKKLHNLQKIMCDECIHLTNVSYLRPLDDLTSLKVLSLFDCHVKLPGEEDEEEKQFSFSGSSALRNYINGHVLPEFAKRDGKIYL